MSQGGQTINHLLHGIDYELIRREPKILCGISDGTALLNAVFAKSGLVTYHGPDLLFTFGREMSEPFHKNLRATFFEGDVEPFHSNPAWRHQESPVLTYGGRSCVRGGRAAGHLVGGHCERVMELLAMGLAPDFNGAILFLEGTENVAYLDRIFTTLRLAGVFDRIAGLVLGWFEWREPEDKAMNRPVSEIVLEVTDGLSFPILEIGELGHNVENYVFPVGCMAEMDASARSLSVVEPTVRQAEQG
jgi:muramoyltetrapeptide carboxypeptidase